MKKILFLFTISLGLMACSSDDDTNGGDNNSLALKSFKFLENNGPNTLDSGKEFFLNQDGKIMKLDILVENLPTALSSQYFYNSDGTRIKIERNHENSLSNTFYYEYDNLSQVKRIINQDESDGDEGIYNFEYSGNTITIKEQLDIWSTNYLYNGNKLVKVASVQDNGEPIQSFELIYNGDNVTQVLQKSENEIVGTYTLEYNDKINPLYSNFNNNTFFYSDIYDLNSPYIMEWVYYISANTFTSIHFENDNPNLEYTETIEIEYNGNNMPISSISYKNRTNTGTNENEVVRRMTYEYH